MTVTVWVVTRIRTGVAAWGRPLPRWCNRLPWRRVSLPNWSTVSWRHGQVSVGGVRRVGFGSSLVGLCGCGARWQGAVAALGVVDDGEVVEQGLHGGEVGGSGSTR